MPGQELERDHPVVRQVEEVDSVDHLFRRDNQVDHLEKKFQTLSQYKFGVVVFWRLTKTILLGLGVGRLNFMRSKVVFSDQKNDHEIESLKRE